MIENLSAGITIEEPTVHHPKASVLSLENTKPTGRRKKSWTSKRFHMRHWGRPCGWWLIKERSDGNVSKGSMNIN